MDSDSRFRYFRFGYSRFRYFRFQNFRIQILRIQIRKIQILQMHTYDSDTKVMIKRSQSQRLIELADSSFLGFFLLHFFLHSKIRVGRLEFCGFRFFLIFILERTQKYVGEKPKKNNIGMGTRSKENACVVFCPKHLLRFSNRSNSCFEQSTNFKFRFETGLLRTKFDHYYFLNWTITTIKFDYYYLYYDLPKLGYYHSKRITSLEEPEAGLVLCKVWKKGTKSGPFAKVSYGAITTFKFDYYYLY